MKAERRQELRTNELAQQIDHAGDYMKQNAAKLTTIIIVAAAVVGSVFWYLKKQQNTLMDGWARLSQRSAMIDSAEPIEKFKAVAEENLEPILTIQAYLRTGQAAFSELGKARAAGKEPSRNFAQIAEDAYTQALNRAAESNVGARGQAMIGLGLLAEDKGDFAKAREWYQKVATDKVFEDSPLRVQAQYRVDNMQKWTSAVVFLPPPPPASQPASQPTDPGAMIPSGMTPVPAAEIPQAVKDLSRKAAAQPTTQPANP